MVPESGWLKPKQAAAYLNRSPDTLKRWRKRGGGPYYARIDGRPLYLKAKLDEWMLSHSGNCNDDFKPKARGSR